MDPVVAVPVLALVAMAALAVPRARKDQRRRETMRAIDVPGSRRDLALIIAMGGDPEKHRIEVVRGQFRGLRLVDDDGKPFRSMTERQLRTPEMRARFKAAERSTSMVIEGT